MTLQGLGQNVLCWKTNFRLNFYCTHTGDRARRIAEVNYDQDKMVERGKALQCSTRQGRRESKKYSKPDKLKKRKAERQNKQKNDRKNSDEDEDDGKEGTDEEEEDIEENEEVDKEEGSLVDEGSDDDEKQVKGKGKGASNQKNQSGVEEKMSDYYNDDVDEIFGKKQLSLIHLQKCITHSFCYPISSLTSSLSFLHIPFKFVNRFNIF